MRAIAMLCVGTLSWMSAGGAWAASFQGLGELTATSGDSVWVSSDGSTVAGSGESDVLEAYRWTFADGLDDIGHLPGGDRPKGTPTTVRGLSADGSTIVGWGRSDLGTGNQGFRWDSESGMQGLGVLPTSTFVPFSRATGISDDGSTIIGWSNSDEGSVAVRWDRDLNIQILGDLPGRDVRAVPHAASADGSIVVGYSSSALASQEAFIWDEENGMRGLGLLPNPGNRTWAEDVSADGTIVVGWGDHAHDIREAFTWTEAGGLRGLGQLGTYSGIDPYFGEFSFLGSQAFGVSADGSRVVGTTTSDRGWVPFIWSEETGMTDLELLLQSMGVDLTGWSLRQARSISADGRVIVGVGINPDVQYEAWIAVIPEPVTSVLLGLGLMGLSTVRPRVGRHVSETPKALLRS